MQRDSGKEMQKTVKDLKREIGSIEKPQIEDILEMKN